MAELSTIARPYAEAAFSAAVASGGLEQWAETIDRMAQLAADGQMKAVVTDPRVPNDKVVGLFMSMLPGAGDEARNFVAVLAANGRLEALPEIALQFRALKAEREGSADADIASAFPLEPEALSRLVVSLEKRFGRKIKPQVHVDQALIGGVMVRVGDEVIDASVRGKLAAMETALRN